MYLMIIMFVISYLMQPHGNKEERKKALINSALVAGATYAATEYTDWGSNAEASLEGMVSGTGDEVTTTTTDPISGLPVTKTVTSTSGSKGLIGSLGNFASSPAGSLALGTVVGATASTSTKNWILIGALAVGAFFILK